MRPADLGQRPMPFSEFYRLVYQIRGPKAADAAVRSNQSPAWNRLRPVFISDPNRPLSTNIPFSTARLLSPELQRAILSNLSAVDCTTREREYANTPRKRSPLFSHVPRRPIVHGPPVQEPIAADSDCFSCVVGFLALSLTISFISQLLLPNKTSSTQVEL